MVNTWIASSGAGFIQLGLGVLLSTYVENMGTVIQITLRISLKMLRISLGFQHQYQLFPSLREVPLSWFFLCKTVSRAIDLFSCLFRVASRTLRTISGGPLHFSSVQFSRSVVSDSLRPHESQHARPPCPSPTPGVHSNSRPSSQ